MHMIYLTHVISCVCQLYNKRIWWWWWWWWLGDRKASTPEKPVPLIRKGSLLEQVEEETNSNWLLVKVLRPTWHKIGHFWDIPQANPLAWYGKNKTWHNKSRHSPIKINVIQHKIDTKKLKPSLVASYDIRPGNGVGLFLFWHFINMSPTYLLRHLPTSLQPQTTRGGRNWNKTN